MSETLIGERKRLTRAAALAERRSLIGAESSSWSGATQEKVLQFPPYILSHSVALYSPIQNEVDTAAVREHALGAGKTVYYPKMGKSCLELLRVDASAEFATGHFGVLEPIGETRLMDPDPLGLMVIVPGVVFDSKGNRLGRGEGWYDRLLKQIGRNAIFLGLAYQFQIVDEVPVDPWDQSVDYVITERRVIDCGATRAQSSLAS